MLTAIEKDDLPMQGNRKKSELRIFAEATVEEFLATSKLGDIAEVTEAPLGKESPTYEATRLVTALRGAAWRTDRHREIRQFRRGERVFLERIKPAKEGN